MALYLYHAYTQEGKKITGTLEASSSGAVRETLIRQKLYPISIQESRNGTAQAAWYRRLFSRSVSLKDKILFTKQLAVLLRSGVPILQAFELLVGQFSEPLNSIIVAIKDGIKEGESLAHGLQRFPNVFPTIYVQLARAGEAGGNLEMILDQLVEYLERRDAITKRIKSALNYPMIQLFIVTGVVIFMLRFIVPNIAKNFQSQGAQLPGSTRFLIWLSDFIGNNWIYLIVSLVLFVIVFNWWRKTESGGKKLDAIKLRLPIVGYFTRMGAVVQFARTLGMLTKGGVNLSESLDIVVKIVDNRILKNNLSIARDQIIKQGKIAEFLGKTGLFPQIAIYLIRTGEESGQLGSMLLTVAKNYEDDVQEYADGLSSKLDPFMMVFMAVVVGFVVISIAEPMMRQSTLIG